MVEIHMHYPNPLWPSQFVEIARQLAKDLLTAGVVFVSIIHFGSTSIPNLNANPIIDILITIPPEHFHHPATLPFISAALRDGSEQGGYYYIGNGGIRDRWSFKLGIRTDANGVPMMPPRNVYVVPDGGIHHLSAVAFRDCLRDEANSDLRDAYGELKWRLAERKDFITIWDYAEEKTEMVGRVLRRAGWTDEQVTMKEQMRERNWPDHLMI